MFVSLNGPHFLPCNILIILVLWFIPYGTIHVHKDHMISKLLGAHKALI